jgi:predicted NAD/FAD-binding protein
MTFLSRAGFGAPCQRRRVAVVGSGAAALGAAWVLAPHHDVTLFEKNDYAGGHAHTVLVPGPGGRQIAVDTGFIVYNDVNYPNLVGLFRHLGIATHAASMGFAVSLDQGRLEYSGGSLKGLLAQKSNLLKPRFLGMIADLLRFYRAAAALPGQKGAEALSLGDYLRRNRYGDGFVEDHILPMAAAIWSAPAECLLDFPAVSFVRFFENHGLLSLTGRPQWRTVTGGSQCYVDRLIADLAGRIHLSSAVTAIARRDGGVRLSFADGRAQEFDEVVLGCHADESLALLTDPSALETELLSTFRFEPNQAWLHGDASLMPKRRATWSAWNYLGDSNADSRRRLSVTYWMNELQGLDPEMPLFVTLNPAVAPAASQVYGQFLYHHPIFDAPAIAAQQRLSEIQGQRHSWFCGGWCGYGFHEDALSSGLRVAQGLGCLPPWAATAPTLAA